MACKYESKSMFTSKNICCDVYKYYDL